MMETWLDRKGWKKIMRLLKEFNWEAQVAKKKNKKDRACGEMLLGIRKGIEKEKVMRGRPQEGLMEYRIRIGIERWRIIGVYVNKDVGVKLEKMREWMEEREEGIKTIIEEDFNARTGEEGGWVGGWEEETYKQENEESRNSKDKKLNKEGKNLVKCIQGRD